jgi:uncharacterized repeat protein (TIGR03803 family)
MSTNIARARRGSGPCCALAMWCMSGSPTDAAGTVTMTVVHQFDGTSEGVQPGTVVFGTDGSLYGTTFSGGAYGAGTIFRIGTDGRFSTIHTFKGPDGNSPDRCLVPGADGALYGTAASSSNEIRVFRVTSTGVLTLLAVFYPEAGAQDQRSVIVRATDGQRYAVSSYGVSTYEGSSSFELVQQGQTARGTLEFRIAAGTVAKGINLPRASYISLESNATETGNDASVQRVPRTATPALCGNINPAHDGHFWLAPLIVDTRSTGLARSSSTDLKDGFHPAIEMYKPRPTPPQTENPDYRSASSASGRLAEDDEGIMLTTVEQLNRDRGEPGIIGVTASGQIARRISLSPLGSNIYPVMGLLRAHDGYFYGLALVDGYSGSILIFRTSAQGPPEIVYRFPQSGPRETIKSPIVQGPDGGLYVTFLDGGKDRRGIIYRVTIYP